MSASNDKSRVAVAAHPLRSFPLDGSHVTTNSFMQVSPTLCFDVIPGSKGKLTVKSFARVDPMKVPTLGSAQIHNRAFFVRYASLFPDFYDFIENNPTTYSDGSSGIPSAIPLFDVYDFMSAMASSAYSSVVNVPSYDPQTGLGTNFDFELGGVFYAFTYRGSYVYRVYKSLGYDLMAMATGDHFYVSALHLLAYARIILDWYWPQQYVALTALYHKIAKFFRKEGTYTLSSTDVADLLQAIDFACYPSDYFVSAWDNPVAPSTGAFSSFSLVDQSSGGYMSVETLSDGTPYTKMSSAANTLTATQYSLNLMQSLSAYMRRHAISGARSLDRWLSDFGLTIRNDKLARSIYLGSDSFPLQIGDVMSHSDTSGAVLGQYAGKGVVYGAGSTFDFDANEDFGVLIVCNTVVPDVGYVQGFDRNVLKGSPLQFYSPEFDGKDVQAISAPELYVSHQSHSFNDLSNATVSDRISNVVFGFTQRYSEYKCLRDNISGDFCCPSRGTGLDSWHTYRLFYDSFFTSAPNIKHTQAFVRGVDSEQYFRIFNFTKPFDPFKFVHRFHIEMSAPMLPMYSDYIFEDEKNHHDQVDIDTGGAKLN